VQDSGPGVDPPDLSHLFERFYRADRSRQRETGGSGLGLAIAKAIVELHGGQIWAESTPPHGTTVFVRMPLSTTSVAASRA
jgi:signal transduction histidine kinase